MINSRAGIRLQKLCARATALIEVDMWFVHVVEDLGTSGARPVQDETVRGVRMLPASLFAGSDPIR